MVLWPKFNAAWNPESFTLRKTFLAESDGETSMANFDPIPYADSVEIIPSDETDDIRRAIEALEKILKQKS